MEHQEKDCAPMVDMYSFYQSMKRSQAAAFQATPPMFAFLDKLFYEGDSAQNSAGISTQQAVDETYAFKLADLFEPRQQSIQNKIQGILLSDVFIEDPMAKIASQGLKKQQIKNVLEKEKQYRESVASMLGKNKAYHKLYEAQQQQIDRMTASELSSSQGTTDDKQSSMQDIELAYLMGPKDLGTA